MAVFVQILLLFLSSSAALRSHQVVIGSSGTITATSPANAQEEAAVISEPKHSNASKTNKAFTLRLEPYQLNQTNHHHFVCNTKKPPSGLKELLMFGGLSRRTRENFIIFDWDDTLFPTKWVKAYPKKTKDPQESAKLMESDDSTSASLAAIQEKVEDLLTKATQMSTVAIISNHDPKWFAQSSKYFMPEVADRVNHGQIVFISTKKMQEEKEIEKADAKQLFYPCLKDLFRTGSIKNVVQFGDKDHDLEAAKALEVTTGQHKIYVRGIKLLEADQPPDVFAEQLDMMNKYLDTIDQEVPESSRMEQVAIDHH